MNDNHTSDDYPISIAVLEGNSLESDSEFATPPDEISVDERRQYIARIPVEIDLHITTPEQKGIARSLDVSVTGLLVQTLLELHWEERVIVTILHPEEDMHACAMVVRVVPGNDSDSGNKYGLRILSDDTVIWQSLLRRLIL